MKVEGIAECPSPFEHSAIPLTCIRQKLVLKTNFLHFLECPYYTCFTVLYILEIKSSNVADTICISCHTKAIPSQLNDAK